MEVSGDALPNFPSCFKEDNGEFIASLLAQGILLAEGALELSVQSLQVSSLLCF
jgi:hypothetical protein